MIAVTRVVDPDPDPRLDVEIKYERELSEYGRNHAGASRTSERLRGAGEDGRPAAGAHDRRGSRLAPRADRRELHLSLRAPATGCVGGRPPDSQSTAVEVTARVYRPDADAPLPCYLYLHGGGWWLGTLDQGDSACRGIATDAGVRRGEPRLPLGAGAQVPDRDRGLLRGAALDRRPRRRARRRSFADRGGRRERRRQPRRGRRVDGA